MSGKTIEIKTQDGVASCQFFAAPQGGKRPAVILYMDAFGVRPALSDMAQRLAGNGYAVLLPDLYYRSGPFKPFNAATAFNDEQERNRLMPLFQSINSKLMMQDTASYLDFLQRETGLRKAGCVGYCMGGVFALSAAGTFPDRIAAAATIHAASWPPITGQPPFAGAENSRLRVHWRGRRVRAFSAEEMQRLATALQFANVKHTMEVIPGPNTVSR